MGLRKTWGCASVTLAAAAMALPACGTAHAQPPDTGQLRAGAASVGLTPGQRIRYATLRSRTIWIDSLRGIAIDTLWLVSGRRVPVAGITFLEASKRNDRRIGDRVRRFALWGAAVGGVLGVSLRSDSSGLHGATRVAHGVLSGALVGALAGGYYAVKLTPEEEWRSVDLKRVHMSQRSPPAEDVGPSRQILRFIDSSAVQSLLMPGTSPAISPLIVVRVRAPGVRIPILGGPSASDRVSRVFRRSGYRTVVAPVRGDTFGLGDDGLREGHARLALGLTGAVLGGVEAPAGLRRMRTAITASHSSGASASAPLLLAVCDNSNLDRALSLISHWECSIFDVMSGKLLYAGAGEDVSALNSNSQRALERALAGFLGLKPSP